MDSKTFDRIYLAALLHDIGKFRQRSEPTYERVRHAAVGAGYLEETCPDYHLTRIVLNHHNPEKYDEFIVAVADKLSAAEREEGGTGGPVRSEPLLAILGQILLDPPKGLLPVEHYVPLAVYNRQELPVPLPDKKAALGHGYGPLWREFDQEFRMLANRGLAQKQDSLLYLLEKYWTRIPSAAYYARATVSLFDHARTTAAIAASLAQSGVTTNELADLNEVLKNRQAGYRKIMDKPQFTLLAGDISGIQEFIYDVPQEGAAKALRGRSFFLTYFTRVLAEYFIRKEGLPLANILLAGGGKFSLLLPLAAEERVTSYRHYVEEAMYTAFGGHLSVLLAAVPLAPSDFLPGRWPLKWDEAAQALQVEKRRRWQTLLTKSPAKILGPWPVPETPCSCCGQAADGSGLCPVCRGLHDLGEKLPRAKFIIQKRISPSSRPANSLKGLLAAFDVEMSLDESPAKDAFNYYLNSYDFLANNGDGFYFVPQLTAGRDFDALAESSEGVKTWAVLRGDVDDLGKIFRQGLGNKATLSAFANLSRAIGEFFGIYFGDLLARYKDRVYTVYAGGDDFCLVGSWSVLPEIAALLRREFGRYVAGNPNVTFSAAIALAPEKKHPLYRMAEVAGDRLDEAKAAGKDRLVFLGVPLHWDELERLKETKDMVHTIIAGGGAKSLLTYLYQAEHMRRQAAKERDLFRIWRVVYMLRRYEQRLPSDLKGPMEKLIDRILIGKNALYPYLAQAARWAELGLRNER